MTYGFFKLALFGFAAIAAMAAAGPADAQLSQSGDIATITTSGTPSSTPGIFLPSHGTVVTNPIAGEVCVGATIAKCGNQGVSGTDPGSGTITVDGTVPTTFTINRHVSQVCSIDDVSGGMCGGTPFSGARLFVGVNETGTVNVINGGQIVINGGSSSDGGAMSISDRIGLEPHGPGADGTVNVDGAGSSITVSGAGSGGVNVGRDGTGHLNVTNGGTVQATPSNYAFNVGGQNFVAGNSTEMGTGFATIANTGSSVSAGVMFIGRSAYGNGTLTLDDNATASTTTNIIGIGYDGGTGAAEVKNGAQLTSATSTFVGRFTGSTGSLNVHDGGTVNIGTGSSLLVGSEGGNGALTMSNGGTVNGTNTTLLIGRSQDAGNTGGVGSADIQDSTVNARSLLIGVEQGSNGTVTVGGNSNINLVDSSGVPGTIAGINVGRDGTGSLTMTGGQITVNAPSAGATAHGVAVGGSSSAVTDNGVGTLTMSGTNTKITMQTGGVIIGRNGHGTLDMSGGAKIDGSAQTLSSGVGFEANGVGVATLSGAGTEWSAGAHNFFIGTNNVAGTMTGTGTVTVANGAQITAANVYVGQGGTLTGNGGIIAGNLVNYGTLAPGASPGTMTVLGDLTLDDVGLVALELGGAAPGQYDHMDVSGTLTLDGTLDVSLYGGYMPTAGSFFDVFTALDVTVGTPIFDFQYVEGIAWSYEIVAGDGNESVRILANAAPEPVSIALFGAGLGGLAFARRRRRG